MSRSYAENVAWLSFLPEQEVDLETVYKILPSRLGLNWVFIFYKNNGYFLFIL